MQRPIEYRDYPGHVVKADKETGILDAYVSLFGIPDHSYWNDIVEPGAFTKTIQECGPKGTGFIKILNQHLVREVIGKPLDMVEHSRAQLPEELRQKYEKATGGLFVKVGLEMRVERVRDVFYLYEGGSMKEWSIGFQAIQSWTQMVDKIEYRHLTEIKLWECSPVTWGAGISHTVSVKNDLMLMLVQCQRDNPSLDGKAILQLMMEQLSPKTAEPVASAPLTVSPEKVALLRKRTQLNLDRLKGYAL